MSVLPLIEDLEARDIRLWIEGAELCFDAPPGAMTSALRERIRGAKQDLMAYLSAGPGTVTAMPFPPLVPEPGEREDYPLSFGQEQIWFFEQLYGRTSVYNIPAAFEIRGPLDAERLALCLQTIARRHGALRAVFRQVGGRPVQHILDPQPFSLPMDDLRDLPLADRRQVALRLAKAEAQRPFDLADGPLMRLRLWRLDDEHHLLQLTTHHIASDGWSTRLFLRELRATCAGGPEGAQPVLLESPVRYTDFCLWQRRLDDEGYWDFQAEYWKRQLQGVPSAMNLPVDRPRPAVQTYRGGVARRDLDDALTARLVDLGRTEKTTLFVVLAAAFEVLLSRRTGELDSVLGFLHWNRTPETRRLIGLFVNTLPLRVDLSGSPTFRRLLARTHEAFVEAVKHGDLPFSRIVDGQRVPRNLSHHPIFQTLVVFETVQEERESSDLKIDLFLVDDEKSKFDLTLFATLRRDRLELALEYSSDLFEAETVARILSSLELLLRASVEDPDLAIGELPLMTAAERQQLLVGFNKTDVPYDLDQCLHQLIERQVRRTPDAPAIVADEVGGVQRSLTFGELDRRANQLARHLGSLGVGRDCLVGVFMDRSPELVVALLGVLKSGAAFVPIDPAYPSQRVAYLLQDAAAPVLLTQRHWAAQVQGFPGAMVCVDADGAGIGELPESPPPCAATPQSPAYVVYTSGSTGQPKGAINSHRAVCNRLLWMQDAFRLDEADRVLHKTPIGFDVSLWELFWSLTCGARMVLARPGGHRDPAYLADVIVRHGVTTLHFVPSMLKQFLRDEGVPVCNDHLKRVICSGEALARDLQDRFFARFRSTRLFNLYGPAEAAIDVTWWECRRGDPRPTVPIGRPISNTQIYILDTRFEPVPIGVPGELYIGGTGVGLGYWNRPELTREQFLRDPFAASGCATLYRTGDRARFLPDGNIEFLGRLDDQVKIHGQRIELVEIEMAIRQHPAVSDAAVVARTDGAGDQVLMAYMVASAGAALPQPGEFRDFLRERVPEFMVPTAFVASDEIPYTPNGKLDRASLPAPPARAAWGGAKDADARTPLERTLAEVWHAVLETDAVGLDALFFDVGGDSIRSIEVVYLARERGVFISVQDVFQHQTIRELARAARTHPPDGQRPAAVLPAFALVSPEDRQRLPPDVEDAYPLTLLQAGLIFHSEQSPEYAVYVTSYRLRALFDQELLDRALRQVVGRHPVMRTSFHVSGFGEPLQLVHREAAVVLQTTDWRDRPAEVQSQLLSEWIENRRRQKFDWRCPPLFDFQVHIRDADSFQFTVVEPFLDGWSVALLTTDVLSVYRDLLAGREPALPSVASTLRDYVALEREALASTELRRFWAEQLDRATVGELPRWPAESEAEEPRFVRRDVPIHDGVQRGLNEMARSLGVPLKSVLLAAHVKVLSLLTGQDEVLTGLMTHGRPESRESRQAVGLFLNVLPLRVELGDGSWRDLVQAMYRAEADVLPYRRYPYAQMIRDHGGSRFDSLFNYIHFYPYRDFAAGDVQIAEITANDQTYFLFTAQFSLDWRSSALRLTLDFNAGGIPDEQIDAFAGYYGRVLARLAEMPAEDHRAACFLGDTEQRKLFEKWKGTRRALPVEKSFLDLFDEQTRRMPDRVAVVDERQRLTYRQLQAWAAVIARTLGRRESVADGPVIAVLGQRSAGLLAALLGVFRAGATYLPLDPDWPPSRIRQLLAQARSKMLLAADDCLELARDCLAADLWDGAPPPQLVRLEGLPLDHDESDRGGHAGTPHSLAYVLYTSGSTGSPKGAMIEHAGMLNHLLAKVEELQLDADVVVAQTARQTFDISVWQFLAPLLVGGRVVIADQDVAADPVALSQFVERRGVHVLETVPALLRLIMEELMAGRISPSSLSGLRWLVVTGEAFSADLYGSWREWYPQIPVVNAYGPTECSDDVTHFIGTGPLREGIATVPIGRPVRNMELFVVNTRLRPVPIGVPGELLVAGIGVGRGYLNDPLQTAVGFIENPFGSRSRWPRVYRTGDLARFLPDGNLEFLGRVDQQVKLHGIRMELSEIESAVRRLPEVQDAAVAKQHIGGKETLVGYIVPSKGAAVETRRLRTFLRQTLPEQMVPRYFVSLESLPLNANGKVDRSSLPVPRPERDQQSQPYIAPQTALERTVAEIWQAVLSVERIGVEDDFFDHGGDSLQAVRLASQLSTALDIHVPVRWVLSYPTVATFCGAVVAELPEEPPAPSSGRGSAAAAPAGEKGGCIASESRSLVRLAASGRLAPVDAAALGYVPDAVLRETGLDRAEVLHGWFGGLPEVRTVYTTSLGRIAHITLPKLASDLYADRPALLDAVAEALELAARLGSRVVSLTGLLASATDYGRAIVSHIGGRNELPAVTTGHGTTAAAVVFSVMNLASVSGGDLRRERLGVLGLGSIGRTALRLLLRTQPHPAEILLCDLYDHQEVLQQLQRELCEDLGFRGDVRLLRSRGAVPGEFYRATLILGATNVDNVLDVESLRPGTKIVDDSAPHCFDVTAAIRRFEQRGDVLFTEAGLLRSSEPIRQLRYLPHPDRERNPFPRLHRYRDSRYEIMGCIFSGLLPAFFDDLRPTIGLVDLESCVQRYERLRELGYGAARLSCLEYRLPDPLVDAFGRRFGQAGEGGPTVFLPTSLRSAEARVSKER